MVVTMVRNIGKYVAVYAAWLVTCALGLLALLVSRQALMVLAVSFVDKWARSALVNWSTLLIGLAWLVVAIFTETYYREGAHQGLLPRRFSRVTLIELAVVAVAALIIQFLS